MLMQKVNYANTELNAYSPFIEQVAFYRNVFNHFANSNRLFEFLFSLVDLGKRSVCISPCVN